MSAIVRASSGGGGAAEIPAGVVYSAEATLTQAQVNAGYDLVAATDGVTLVIVGYYIRFIGTWNGGGATLLHITDTADTNQISFEEMTFSAETSYTETNFDGVVPNLDMRNLCQPLTEGRGIRIGKSTGSWSGGGTLRARVLYRRIVA